MKMKSEMDDLCAAVLNAGLAILGVAEDGLEAKQKINHDPVTKADLMANRILYESLAAKYSHYGWLSEETHDDRSRLSKERVWIVDPLDGTREFTEYRPEYAVSVALVEEGIPVIAAVYNPATNEFFTAVRGAGIWLNGESIRGKSWRGNRLSILASRSQFGSGKFESFEAYAQIHPIGSVAYKLALVAAGKADATFSLEPKNEWDIAAGVLMVEEAGGTVTDKTGITFVFNRPDTLVNGIIAATSGAYDPLQRLIADHGI